MSLREVREVEEVAAFWVVSLAAADADAQEGAAGLTAAWRLFQGANFICAGEDVCFSLSGVCDFIGVATFLPSRITGEWAQLVAAALGAWHWPWPCDASEPRWLPVGVSTPGPLALGVSSSPATRAVALQLAWEAELGLDRSGATCEPASATCAAVRALAPRLLAPSSAVAAAEERVELPHLVETSPRGDLRSACACCCCCCWHCWLYLTNSCPSNTLLCKLHCCTICCCNCAA